MSAEQYGCCGECGGGGIAADGPCWDCRGTGHPHPDDGSCRTSPAERDPQALTDAERRSLFAAAAASFPPDWDDGSARQDTLTAAVERIVADRLSARPVATTDTVWLCAKCGHGGPEHSIKGHVAFDCVADMRLVPSRAATTDAAAQAWVVVELHIDLPEPPPEGEPHPAETPVGPFPSRAAADSWASAHIAANGSGGSWTVSPLLDPGTRTARRDTGHHGEGA